MPEENKWISVFKTNKAFEAELYKSKLEHSGIPAVIVNKQDSSYLSFGSVELHVPEDQKEEALLIINEKATGEE